MAPAGPAASARLRAVGAQWRGGGREQDVGDGLLHGCCGRGAADALRVDGGEVGGLGEAQLHCARASPSAEHTSASHLLSVQVGGA